jgi:hypothetical protein
MLGALVFELKEIELKQKKRLVVELSDEGLCGGRPHVSELLITWQGGRKNPDRLTVRTRSEHVWTTEDRVKHKKRVAPMRSSNVARSHAYVDPAIRADHESGAAQQQRRLGLLQARVPDPRVSVEE